MNAEPFWEPMETCRRQAEGRDARLAWLRAELSRRSQVEIVEFQLCLDQVTRQAFHGDNTATTPGRRQPASTVPAHEQPAPALTKGQPNANPDFFRGT
ncbi:DUF4240 domain-containing protein [Streptomyces scopuliridis]